ncbi:uracil nucleotide/cysteinyl leukotriene receptor [Ornithorhynchus anatinus]|uniref:Uracil nucleotide/cysteinyl leukotriene receptor n=1 Tax=Ornithorhynchus anatinus TaxID=9258 RepID=A0A6I8NYA4_ORNAN|nr:uracil nucleotide/cysteinyl leukotriene receptor [Ornithorhynchus anatinus]XP_028916189.1 uracil nucleotide/cysteinyl leukotriene receptor [Ornithorhynchus anatinus]XP_028916206.1 uracil nucleotide/cysteinyl leukotriene receptor [Ornithorhynchus anatinus]XP_039768776.1 uracil nucleotide/cysteinyl leukotriene receptor [Ornithorhynchus anatinus]
MDGLAVDPSNLFFNTSLETSEQCGKETALENILFASFYLLDFILAFAGNTLALWLFIRDQKSGTPANIFLMHLAVADLSFVLVLPTRLVYHFSGNHWPFGEIPCRLTGFLFYLNMYASIYFLTCISADRFLAIVHPVKSIKLRRPLYAHLACAFLWVIVAVAMAPLLVSVQTAEMNSTTVCLQLYREKASRHALVSLAVAFTFPFVTTVTCYLLIIRSLRSGSRVEKHLKDKAIKMIVMVLMIFLICFVPYHVNRYIYVLHYDGTQTSCETQRVLALGNRITSCLTSLNGALDPVMYFFVAEKFREALCNLLCGRKVVRLPPSFEGKTNESSLSAKSEL